MAIEGLNSIMRQRESQYGHMGQKQQPVQQTPTGNADEALKLFFDYIEKSNAQIMATCVTILNNQKILGSEIEAIKKILQDANLTKEE